MGPKLGYPGQFSRLLRLAWIISVKGVPENRGTGNSIPQKFDRNISDLTYILVNFVLGLVWLG